MGGIHGVKPFSFATNWTSRATRHLEFRPARRYLDGFATAVFHRVSSTFDARPSADSLTYQVLRGSGSPSGCSGLLLG